MSDAFGATRVKNDGTRAYPEFTAPDGRRFRAERASDDVYKIFVWEPDPDATPGPGAYVHRAQLWVDRRGGSLCSRILRAYDEYDEYDEYGDT